MKATIPAEKKQHKPWISEKTLELAKIKRQLKQRRQNSDSLAAEYRKRCNEVRKAARMDKERWLQEQCQEIEKHAGDITGADKCTS